ncbi:MAG: transposase [SAR324 cluster bacterium]|nr:transposase [SAR324 cluster bacterium]
MPRQARIVIPNLPHHVIQRGHNKQVIFKQSVDFETYLANLQEGKKKFGIKVYAYCLMSNHVHLLLEPGENIEELGKLMKQIAGRQTRYVNRGAGRTGTLWESRYKSSPVDSESYLLACSRYIELNPIRAGMVSSPVEYPWSSYPDKIGLRSEKWLDLDPIYKRLGSTAKERQRQYADFVEQSVPTEELQRIRNAVQRGQLTGPARFVDEVEKKLKKRIESRGPGRPKKIK